LPKSYLLIQVWKTTHPSLLYTQVNRHFIFIYSFSAFIFSPHHHHPSVLVIITYNHSHLTSRKILLGQIWSNDLNSCHKLSRLASQPSLLTLHRSRLSPPQHTHTHIHLVRPHLEYASEVWSPHQIFLKDMLEAVQRRATKLVIKNKNKPYKERLQELNLQPLTSRRAYLDLVSLYKCLHNYIDIELPSYLNLYDTDTSTYNLRNNELTFISIDCKTNSFLKGLKNTLFFHEKTSNGTLFPLNFEKRQH